MGAWKNGGWRRQPDISELEWVLRWIVFVQGRITEVQLPLAEKVFPGIAQLYRELPDKSLTFLQLVWLYEEARENALMAAAPVEESLARTA